jgi:cation diffusion facilitator CzcD-associated flavoprotein CzcO
MCFLAMEKRRSIVGTLSPTTQTSTTSNTRADSHDSIKKFETEPDSYLQFRLQIEKKLAYSFKGLWANSNAAEEFTQNAKQHMINKIDDPQALKALLPTEYKAGCRRFTPADEYIEALNQSNVELISTPIKQVEGNAIITTDDKRRTYDMIVCGTGFEPYAPRFPIKGRGTANLSDLWSMDGGYESYLAATVAGFPNFFGM